MAVPLNLRLGRAEWPIGLALIALVLIACAVVNLFTKQVATIAGISFTLAFFGVFVTSERIMLRRRGADAVHLDPFQLEARETISTEALRCRPGGVLVPVRNYHTLAPLDWILGQPESVNRDVVVLTVRVLGDGAQDAGGQGDRQIFSEYEQQLFTRVVAIAERHGRTVTLLITPGTNIFDAVAQSAAQLESGLIVVGAAEAIPSERQALLLGQAWDRAAGSAALSTRLAILGKDGRATRFSLGVHTPDLTSADLELIHRTWVKAVEAVGPDIHHRDIVTIALRRLDAELDGPARPAVVQSMRDTIERKDALI